MQKIGNGKLNKKGQTLITALLILVFISLIIAVIGYIYIYFFKSEGKVFKYKTVKEAATAVAYSVIYMINQKNLTFTNPSCTVGCNSSSSNGCKINLPQQIEKSLSDPHSNFQMCATAYLLLNCSEVYTVKVIATKQVEGKVNATSIIYFIYQAP
jgi:hypothetical protein